MVTRTSPSVRKNTSSDGIEIVEDRLSGRVALPGAAALDPLDRLGGEAREHGDPLERIALLLGLRLRHLVSLRLVQEWRTIDQATLACMTKMPPTEDLACVGKVYIRRTGETGGRAGPLGQGLNQPFLACGKCHSENPKREARFSRKLRMVLSGEIKGDRHDPLQVT